MCWVFRLEWASHLQFLSQFYGFRGSGTRNISSCGIFFFSAWGFSSFSFGDTEGDAGSPVFGSRSQFLHSLTQWVAGYTSLASAAYANPTYPDCSRRSISGCLSYQLVCACGGRRLTPNRRCHLSSLICSSPWPNMLQSPTL